MRLLGAAALDDDDRTRGGAADRAGLAVVELDRERVLGNVHAHHLAGVYAAELWNPATGVWTTVALTGCLTASTVTSSWSGLPTA